MCGLSLLSRLYRGLCGGVPISIAPRFGALRTVPPSLWCAALLSRLGVRRVREDLHCNHTSGIGSSRNSKYLNRLVVSLLGALQTFSTRCQISFLPPQS